MAISNFEMDLPAPCRVDGVPAFIIGHLLNPSNELMLITRNKLGFIQTVMPAQVHLEAERDAYNDEWEWAEPEEEE